MDFVIPDRPEALLEDGRDANRLYVRDHQDITALAPQAVHELASAALWWPGLQSMQLACAAAFVNLPAGQDEQYATDVRGAAAFVNVPAGQEVQRCALAWQQKAPAFLPLAEYGTHVLAAEFASQPAWPRTLKKPGAVASLAQPAKHAEGELLRTAATSAVEHRPLKPPKTHAAVAFALVVYS